MIFRLFRSQIDYQFKLISTILVINRVWFLHSNLDMGLYLKKKPLFHHYRKENQQKPLTNYVYGNLALV